LSATIGVPLGYIIKKVSPLANQIRIDFMGGGTARVGMFERDEAGKIVKDDQLNFRLSFYGLKTHVIDINETTMGAQKTAQETIGDMGQDF